MSDGAGPIATTRLRAQIDLPTGVAVWVLLAHALTLASPFVLLWSVQRNADVLSAAGVSPVLLDVAAGLFLLGSAFEVAQNTADRWYYEGPYPAFSDLLFNGLIAAGLGAFALAAADGRTWVAVVVLLGLVAFPVLYLRDLVPYPVTGVLGVLGVGLLYVRLDDPVVLLMLLFSPGLNLYFLELIVRTRAQALHGAIALSNGIGLLAVVLAIESRGAATATPWTTVVAIAAAMVVGSAAAWPRLSRLAPTVRPSGAPPGQPGERFAATLDARGRSTRVG